MLSAQVPSPAQGGIPLLCSGSCMISNIIADTIHGGAQLEALDRIIVPLQAQCKSHC